MRPADFTWAWEAPLAVAAQCTTPQDSFVLLHSARLSPDARYSYLALNPQRIFTGSGWNLLEDALTTLPQGERLFGYASYELGAEHAPQSSTHTLPEQWWMLPATLLRFDLIDQRIEGWGEEPVRHAAPISDNVPCIETLTSNFSGDAYREKVAAILEDIRAGEYYQANLTRKFLGRMSAPPDSLTLFARLCTISPAPFAALIHTPDWQIISSSMEEFLHVENGQARARPIKGTCPRGATPQEDTALAAALSASTKDRAENIMIVDLMRHDLSQVCTTGSLRVEKLCALESYAQLHHLVSTIEGSLRADCGPLDALRACFPPGSMTGAPKRASVRRLAELEASARGPYSGMLGWIAADAAQTSVVIRTLILEGACFEFQVGGGIVQDSNPEQEWRETLVKARGMAELLSISPNTLAEQ